MSIRYHPKRLLKRFAKKKAVEKLVSRDLTLNKAAVSTLAKTGILKKKTLETIAIKVIKGYRKRYGDERKAGASVAEAQETAIAGKDLMVHRVQSAAVHEISKEIKSQFRGEFYVWLPSEANEPDPLHQLNYGLTFQLGVGEQPGDRYGCLCGMEILVDQTQLQL